MVFVVDLVEVRFGDLAAFVGLLLARAILDVAVAGGSLLRMRSCTPDWLPRVRSPPVSRAWGSGGPGGPGRAAAAGRPSPEGARLVALVLRRGPAGTRRRP
ncbi:hypothetical protein [Streptomyces sp. x-19]|uniref:hypothetical protein n=1 Tax=Streptomyces sp. x-19 TaxID=2789280 RepID=UPI00397E93A6